MTFADLLRFGVSPAPTVTTQRDQVTTAHGLDLADLLVVARRDNPRRQVLFVSTVLGKHLAVDPGLPVLAGMALGDLAQQQIDAVAPDTTGRQPTSAATAGARLAEVLASRRRVTSVDLTPSAPSGPCIVLGFAETATGLTHAVRRRLGVGPLGHTTRVDCGAPLLEVTESHSHATHHRVHHDDPDLLVDDAPVVIVDDEFTTGATALDMVLGIQRRWPRRRYLLASLIDWRPEARRQEMIEVVAGAGARLDSVALIDAEVDIGPAPLLDPLPPTGPLTTARGAPHVDVLQLDVGPPTARRGWTAHHQSTVDERLATAAVALARRRHGDAVLVLGLEELMYVPMLLGVHQAGDVRTRSTTRSPIVPASGDGYPIRDRIEFPPTDGGAGSRFLYNLGAERYDDVFVVADAPHPPVDHPLFRGLSAISPHLHLVSLT